MLLGYKRGYFDSSIKRYLCLILFITSLGFTLDIIQNTPFQTNMNEEEDFSVLFDKIDELKPKFFERLSKAIEIPAVSSNGEYRPHLFRKADFIVNELRELGFSDIQKCSLGLQPGAEDAGLELPPVILARYGTDAKKKTILVYTHYDVQPASIKDGWDTDPFKCIIDEKKKIIYGRGVSDDTGPLTAWLNVVEAYNKVGKELPVNLVFCFEGMEESGSVGLKDFLIKEAQGYFKGVDSVCITDTTWLGVKKPALTYGLRGVHYYQITVSGPAVDLHSGSFGGAVSEPMIDLVKVLNSLVDVRGNILINGVNDMVLPVTDDELKLYKNIDYSIADLNETVGANISLYTDATESLMHRSRYPSLSIHGVQGAFHDPGSKTVIPAKVMGKFSIRTVPNMDSAKLNELVLDHCQTVFNSLGSLNKCTTQLLDSGPYWVLNTKSNAATAASKAMKKVFNVEPDLVREGGSIPITISFQEILKTDVLLLPIGRSDDRAHSINEKLDFMNYFGGMKVIAAYLYLFSQS